jgi:hypothetical protein
VGDAGPEFFFGKIFPKYYIQRLRKIHRFFSKKTVPNLKKTAQKFTIEHSSFPQPSLKIQKCNFFNYTKSNLKLQL